MISSFLVKTNYLNHYSLRLLIGNFLLIVPTFCIVPLVALWGNYNSLMILPLSLSIGVILIYPSLLDIARPSKERVAVDALLGGFGMMAILLCVIQDAFITKPINKQEQRSKEQMSAPNKAAEKKYSSTEAGLNPDLRDPRYPLQQEKIMGRRND